ncbi:hypothetical protein ACFL5H_03990 [Candidatus Latescibacterota bacterium]
MENYLKIDSTYVCIRWDTDSISDIIKNMFSTWRVSSVKPTHFFDITSHNSGFSLKTPLGSVQCSDEKTLAANLEYSLTLLAQEVYSQNLQLHASCVDFMGKGVLFVGPHSAGKTTLALTAIASGFRALTDDVAIVGESHTQIYGFPRPFKVCDDIWNMQPTVVPLDCPHFKVTPETTYLFFYLPDGRYYAEITLLKYIIFPVRNDNPTMIRELGETESLSRLLLQGFNCYQKKNGRVDELLDTIRKTSSFEIVYNSNWDLLKKVRELLVTCSPKLDGFENELHGRSKSKL